MDKETVELAVIIAGIVVGSITMLVAVWVWLRKQVFGYPGTLLSFFGTLLIGLSVFSRAQISIGEVEIVLERLRQEVTDLEQENQALVRTNETIASQFVTLAKNVELQQKELVSLGTAVSKSDAALREPVADLTRRLDMMAAPDYRALEEAIRESRISVLKDDN